MADSEEDMIPVSVERQRKQAKLDKAADLAAIAYLDGGIEWGTFSQKGHDLQLDFARKKVAALKFKHGIE
jgi:hypothetical protein